MTIYIQSMCDCGIWINDVMCDNITYEDLHLANVAGMGYIISDDLTYDDQIQECVRLLYWD